MNNFQLEAYRTIKFRFDNAERQLPEGKLPWWMCLWRWVTRKTEKQIINKGSFSLRVRN